MEDSKSTLLKDIQTCKFALIEVELFLDVNPDSQEALKFYKMHADKLHGLLMEWEERYGKVQSTVDNQMRWAWVDNPWPWEMGV